ncbi:hypothetical protein H6G76_24030 [Nostoc sp. FACHB-152]|uniref:hypothetical protein n=1 Tax=unclassified Nostoc TaxID=2593658 RepID=UPI001682F990|nr:MULTISPECIES: hypothetical protein [unclassified Nostoc]MBD2450174.1 hypothetical protein [Nostoc sp. FACHB-152]MBD2471357.1 hypothetical protein [Nostoc sp. FACHB-145]
MNYSAMQNIQVSQQLSSEPLEMAVAATEIDSVMLAEKLTEYEVPLKVLLQALAIAAYDGAAAIRYAEQYLNKRNKQKQILLRSFSNARRKRFLQKQNFFSLTN